MNETEFHRSSEEGKTPLREDHPCHTDSDLLILYCCSCLVSKNRDAASNQGLIAPETPAESNELLLVRV